MPQSLRCDQLSPTNMHFFNPDNGPGQPPQNRAFFTLWGFFLQRQHLPPPAYWVETSPAGADPPPLPWLSLSSVSSLCLSSSCFHVVRIQNPCTKRESLYRQTVEFDLRRRI